MILILQKYTLVTLKKENQVIFPQNQNQNKKIEEIWVILTIPWFIKIKLNRFMFKKYKLQIKQAKENIIKIIIKLNKN